MKDGQACGDCGLFDHSKGKAGECEWGIAECKGPKSRHAGYCPLFMDADGRQWLLECDDDQLPDWAKSDQPTLDGFLYQDFSITNPHEDKRISF